VVVVPLTTRPAENALISAPVFRYAIITIPEPPANDPALAEPPLPPFPELAVPAAEPAVSELPPTE
jgi:hypothetical protein